MWDVTVYCDRGWTASGKEIPSVVVFRGKLPVIPRRNEGIVVWEGWCVQDIKNVYYRLEAQAVDIAIGADNTGEYLIEARKRGIKQSGDDDEKES